MTKEEFVKIKSPKTIQDKIDIEFRWYNVEMICKANNWPLDFIHYDEESDKLYFLAILE